jgi:hypothetical protein
MQVVSLVLAVPKTPKTCQKCSQILFFDSNNILGVFGLKSCAYSSIRHLHSSIINNFILGVAKMKSDYKTFYLFLEKNKKVGAVLWKKQATRSLFFADLEIEPDKCNFGKTIRYAWRPGV